MVHTCSSSRDNQAQFQHIFPRMKLRFLVIGILFPPPVPVYMSSTVSTSVPGRDSLPPVVLVQCSSGPHIIAMHRSWIRFICSTMVLCSIHVSGASYQFMLMCSLSLARFCYIIFLILILTCIEPSPTSFMTPYTRVYSVVHVPRAVPRAVDLDLDLDLVCPEGEQHNLPAHTHQALALLLVAYWYD